MKKILVFLGKYDIIPKVYKEKYEILMKSTFKGGATNEWLLTN